MNFSEFARQNKPQNDKKTQKTVEQDVRKSYDELKNLNSDELSKRLFDEVNKQKANNTFNYDALKSSIESIETFLPRENYLNLLKILEMLK